MSHDTDCPARYGCCPNDEYGCPIHVEPPCNCQPGDPTSVTGGDET